MEPDGRLIIAIDPGDVDSAWVVYNTKYKVPVAYGYDDNKTVLDMLRSKNFSTESDTPKELPEVVIEMIASYGMPVGASVFDTCVWSGRFAQAATENPNTQDIVRFIVRKDIKMHLCGTPKAKDSNISQAICDRYGGTVKRAKGTKKNPGPLYGFKSDIWAAMGVAITAAETDYRYIPAIRRQETA